RPARRAAPGGRHADPDLLVARDPVEQELEAGQEGGEESGAALPDERLEARRGVRAEPSGAAHAGSARLVRARPVRRQLENRHRPGEALRPESAQSLAVLARKLQRLALDPLLISRRGRQELRRNAAGLLLVELAELAQDDRQGPEVGDEVVEDEQRGGAAAARAAVVEDPQPHERSVLRIERPQHLRLEALADLAAGEAGGVL